MWDKSFATSVLVLPMREGGENEKKMVLRHL